MNYDAKTDEWLEQNRLLAEQLAALDTLSSQKRGKWRLLEWVCASCGEIALEVMDTHPWRTVRTWREEDGRRTKRWKFRAIGASRPAESAQAILFVVCRCQRREMPEAAAWDDLEQGRRKRVLDAFHDPGHDETL